MFGLNGKLLVLPNYTKIKHKTLNKICPLLITQFFRTFAVVHIWTNVYQGLSPFSVITIYKTQLQILEVKQNIVKYTFKHTVIFNLLKQLSKTLSQKGTSKGNYR